MENDETWHMNTQIPALKYDAKQPQNMEKWHPMLEMKPVTRNEAHRMTYCYTKNALFDHEAWRQMQDSPKTCIFPVYNKSQKWTQIGLIYHAKMALKERLNTKGQKLAPNGKEPFNKVEEGLKKTNFTVYGKVQNTLQVSLKYYRKIGLKGG